MLEAWMWGALATSSLLLGGWLACRYALSRRTLGLLMAFGAGTLISAVSFELVFAALQRSRGSGVPALGFFAGALCFYFCDRWIEAIQLRHRKAPNLAMLVAIFLSNLPEAVAGTVGMKSSGWSAGRILLLWMVIALVCASASALGYGLFEDAPKAWLSLIQAFAGGAILVMLTNSMIPESYDHAGKLAGIFTVLGFFISVSIAVLEAAQVVASHG
jgi:zinc transporter, ZIP family